VQQQRHTNHTLERTNLIEWLLNITSCSTLNCFLQK